MNTFPPPPFVPVQISTQPRVGLALEPRAVTSETLLAGCRELVIKHAGRDYHLRLTKQGKLILTA